MEAALRELYSSCGVGQACYDPALDSWAPWGWPEWMLVILGLILLTGLLMAVLSNAPAKKPDTPSKIVADKLNKYRSEAGRWKNPEAERAFDNALAEINAEFAKQRIP